MSQLLVTEEARRQEAGLANGEEKAEGMCCGPEEATLEAGRFEQGWAIRGPERPAGIEGRLAKPCLPA